MSDLSSRFRYRLVHGDDQRWLCPGLNTIGSSSNNDIVLSVQGVSRHHATVALDGDALEVQDLHSKNGTLINGCAVSSSPFAPGDELGIGPVALKLWAVDHDDAEIAIECARPSIPLVSDGTSRLTATLASADAARGHDQLRFVASFFSGLTEPEAGYEPCLLGLTDLLGARACAILMLPGGERTAVVAAVGSLDGLPSNLDVYSGIEDEAAGQTIIRVRDCLAVIEKRGSVRFGLVAIGLPDTASNPGPLLGTLLRLIVHIEDSQPVIATARRRKTLVMPAGIVPSSVPSVRALYEQIGLLHQGNLPVLILGESGVGKEHLARLVHDTSLRRERPFVAINCAAIPTDLLEAEMFGIGRGVATGVVSREGTFRLADGGTLFLDEIGDMSLTLQAKLLRSLQEREIVPLGCAPVRVDVRIVAATNIDLQRRLAEGDFRKDLYYRLAGYEIEVPPLRQRLADLPALIGHFVRVHSKATGKSIRGVSVRALRRLCAYPWPGNVRELENIVRRLVYACPDGQTIESGLLPPAVADPRPVEPTLDELRRGSISLPGHLKAIERQMIRQALGTSHGNQTAAAKLLGISRNGLAYRLKRLDLKRLGLKCEGRTPRT